MWRFGVLVGFMLLLSSFVVSASGATAHTPKCPRHLRYLRVVRADAQAVVYSGMIEGERDEAERFACAYRRRHVYELEEFPEGGSGERGTVGPLAMAGDVVAWEQGATECEKYTGCCPEFYGAPGCGEWHVTVRNLLTGRRTEVLTSEYTRKSPPGFDFGGGPAVDIVVRADGSAAWIVRDEAPAATRGLYEVHVLEGSTARVLAVNADIDPSSLALAGSTLYWTEDGKPMSAILG